MLRNCSARVVQRIGGGFKQAIGSAGTVRQSHGAPEESPEEFDERFIKFFNQPGLDGWWLRKGLTELHGADVVPDPAIICAALRACRRVNDIALAIRVQEAVYMKCGHSKKQIYPWIVQEITPTCQELGIPTLDECGYLKPELWLPTHDFWFKGKDDEHVPNYGKGLGVYHPQTMDKRLFDYRNHGDPPAKLSEYLAKWNRAH